jgi:hypothetical protein
MSLMSPAALGIDFLILLIGLALGLSWRFDEMKQEIDLRKKWEKVAKELVGFQERKN